MPSRRRVRSGWASVLGVAACLAPVSAWAYGPDVCDFDGDDKTDHVVVRNVGGGGSGQVRWFVLLSSSSSVAIFDWGLASDFFLCGDFDGDNLHDAAVWRPGSPGTFWVRRSSGGVTVVHFGLTGDDPTVIGDYDGDGRDDLAFYRAGAPSTWWYRRSSDSAVLTVPWGQSGDFPAPGDFTGDGRADFTIQRNGGAGQAIFWQLSATGPASTYVWGTPTDVITPLDYSGDGRVDTTVVRGVAGAIQWWGRNSATATPIAGMSPGAWGASATDFATAGDYDGDGKADLAIWRPGSPSFFWVLRSATSTLALQRWGSNGDYPVANFNAH